jgi:hypothetical protein
MTYDGNLSVISEHHVKKPSEIIVAAKIVIAHSQMFRTTSKNRPKNELSNSLYSSIEYLMVTSEKNVNKVQFKRAALIENHL